MKPCDECVIREDYDKLYHLVQYIANDYVELSYEKVRIQRDDYMRLAQRLLKQINEYE